MSEINRKQLIKTADDMTDVMGLKPAIDTELETADLQAAIIESAKDISPDDVFEATTVKTLTALGCLKSVEVPKEKEAVSKKKKQDDADAAEAAAVEKRAAAKAAADAKPLKRPGKKGKDEPEAAPASRRREPAKASAPAAAAPKKEKTEKSAYGHRANTSAGAIDKAISGLKKAKTYAEIATLAGCDEKRVIGHVRHLIKNELVKLVVKEGTVALG